MYNLKQIGKIVISHSASRYLAIGAFAFACDYVVLVILYKYAGASLSFATGCGFLTGFLVGFLFNKNWVFANKANNPRIWRQFIQYGLLVCFNFVFSVRAVVLLSNNGVSPYLSKIVIMIMIVCWNYIILRWVIFSTGEKY